MKETRFSLSRGRKKSCPCGPRWGIRGGRANVFHARSPWRLRMAEPVLKAHDVWKSYDGRSDVLRGVSLAVDAGDAVVVDGPTGSGVPRLRSILRGLRL